jgi:hypothetical protein
MAIRAPLLSTIDLHQVERKQLQFQKNVANMFQLSMYRIHPSLIVKYRWKEEDQAASTEQPRIIVSSV